MSFSVSISCKLQTVQAPNNLENIVFTIGEN